MFCPFGGLVEDVKEWKPCMDSQKATRKRWEIVWKTFFDMGHPVEGFPKSRSRDPYCEAFFEEKAEKAKRKKARKKTREARMKAPD